MSETEKYAGEHVPKSRKVSVRKWLVVVNVASLIGIAISLFTVPPQTPFWLWATIAGVTLAGINIVFWRVRGKIGAKQQTSGMKQTIIIYVGLGLLILDLILSRFHH